MRALAVSLLFVAAAAAQEPGGGLVIEPQTLPPGLLGSTFGTVQVPPPGLATFDTVIFDVPLGAGSFSYNVVAGSLPPGVTLTQTGVFAGEPTQTGDFVFLVEAISTQDEIVTQAFGITVGAPLVFASSATVGVPFDLPLSCDPPEDYSYRMLPAPPAGLTFDPSTGNVFGTPSGPPQVYSGSWTCASQSNTFALDITIDIEPGRQQQLSITPPTLPSGNVGTSYAATPGVLPNAVNFNPIAFNLQGSSAEPFFQVSSGSLPPGLTLMPTGELEGVPTQAGTFSFTVQAFESLSSFLVPRDDKFQQATQANYTITILPPLQSSLSASIGSAFSLALRCPPTTATYAYSVAGSLPPGLSLNPATGAIAGTVQGPAGTTPFSWFCVDSQSARQARIDFNFNVAGRPLLTFNAELNRPFSADLAFGGGTAPFVYRTFSGQLPPGISLDSATGRLSGIPAGLGLYTFSVEKATGSASFQADV